MQEAAQEIAPERTAENQPAGRRRRSAHRSYSDYVVGEPVAELPDAPEWPQMAQQAAQTVHSEEKKSHKLLDRMAKMIEPEDEQLVSRAKLPPRVNMQDAYKPAAAPRKPGRRG